MHTAVFLAKVHQRACALMWKEFPKNFAGVANFAYLMTDVISQLKFPAVPKWFAKSIIEKAEFILSLEERKLKSNSLLLSHVVDHLMHIIKFVWLKVKSDFVRLSCDHRLQSCIDNDSCFVSSEDVSLHKFALTITGHESVNRFRCHCYNVIRTKSYAMVSGFYRKNDNHSQDKSIKLKVE